MPRNIVLCCDGTANEFAKNNTNVVKLYSILTQDARTQVSYYHPGLGTMEPAGALTTFARKVTKGLGMAFGYGLAHDLRDAYVFLMRNYQPGDRVFLFGFSRGAYTARAVASLLKMYGLIRPDNESLVPYAIRMLLGIERGRRGRDDSAMRDYFTLASAFKKSMSGTECKPHFVGVWDTVSSVGWIENPLKLPYVTSNPDINIGRHAVALDERRAFFRSHLWLPAQDPTTPSGPRDLKQVWFPGVHCDVGGGYPEGDESALSNNALWWMVVEAETAGLLVDSARRAALSPPRGVEPPQEPPALHESLEGWWRLAELVPKNHYDKDTGKERRRMNLFRRRAVPPGSLVHVSAYERGDAYRARLPPDAIRVGGAEPHPALGTEG
jgi:uncharacterized protein (DUF2235 family)